MAQCHFQYSTGKHISDSTPQPFRRKATSTYFDVIYCKMPWVIPIWRKVQGRNGLVSTNGAMAQAEPRPSDLQPGDWVEVIALEDIEKGLDQNGRLYGLNFMPEMRKYCGHRFKVFKRVNRMMLESTGELRTIKRPTFYLEGVYCDGEFHEGCDRSCFLLWREDWLKKVKES